MKLKKGVKLNGVKSEILVGIMVADSIYIKFDPQYLYNHGRVYGNVFYL